MSFNNFQKQPQQPFYQNQNVAPVQQNQFIDGILYDTFDCSDNYIWCIYRVK